MLLIRFCWGHLLYKHQKLLVFRNFRQACLSFFTRFLLCSFAKPSRASQWLDPKFHVGVKASRVGILPSRRESHDVTMKVIIFPFFSFCCESQSHASLLASQNLHFPMAQRAASALGFGFLKDPLAR